MMQIRFFHAMTATEQSPQRARLVTKTSLRRCLSASAARKISSHRICFLY